METLEDISEVVSHIRETLAGIGNSLPNHPQVSQEAVGDILSQFLIWTGSLGAGHKPSSDLSLEYRLRHAPHIKKYISNILCRLSADSRDLQTITTGEKPDRNLKEDWGDLADAETSPSRDDAIRKPDTEAEMLLDVISNHMKSLFRVSVLVRKASSEDRFQRAIRARGHPFMVQFDMDYLSTRFPKLNTFAHVPGSQYSWIVVRLGQANIKRRQFIRCCRDHPEKPKPDMTQEQSDPAPIQTEDDNVSATPTSTIPRKKLGPSLPRLKSLQNGKTEFECPICYSHQTMNDNNTWQRHAFSDLKAYVCTVGEECGELMFPDRDSWFKHEIERHHLQFVCFLCPAASPVPRQEFREHLLTHHGNFDDSQLDALEHVCGQPPLYLREAECPFCYDWIDQRLSHPPERGASESQYSSRHVTVEAFKAHVARHLEQVSIFAIPRPPEDLEAPVRKGTSKG